MEYITFLVENVYISGIYKQTGLPMGTECAPMLANSFLFRYEYAYTKEMLKTAYGTALATRHTVWYVVDLLTFNNHIPLKTKHPTSTPNINSQDNYRVPRPGLLSGRSN